MKDYTINWKPKKSNKSSLSCKPLGVCQWRSLFGVCLTFKELLLALCKALSTFKCSLKSVCRRCVMYLLILSSLQKYWLHAECFVTLSKYSFARWPPSVWCYIAKILNRSFYNAILSAWIILITTVTILWNRFPKCLKQTLFLWKCFQSLIEIKKVKYEPFPFLLAFWPLRGSCKGERARLNLFYRLNLQKTIQKVTKGHMYMSSFCIVCSVYSPITFTCLLSIILISACS